jgi:hypothetical protein
MNLKTLFDCYCYARTLFLFYTCTHLLFPRVYSSLNSGWIWIKILFLLLCRRTTFYSHLLFPKVNSGLNSGWMWITKFVVYHYCCAHLLFPKLYPGLKSGWIWQSLMFIVMQEFILTCYFPLRFEQWMNLTNVIQEFILTCYFPLLGFEHWMNLNNKVWLLLLCKVPKCTQF